MVEITNEMALAFEKRYLDARARETSGYEHLPSFIGLTGDNGYIGAVSLRFTSAEELEATTNAVVAGLERHAEWNNDPNANVDVGSSALPQGGLDSNV